MGQSKHTQWSRFQTECMRHGLVAYRVNSGHWQVHGGETLVNYYPKRKTVFVAGTAGGKRGVKPEKAVQIAIDLKRLRIHQRHGRFKTYTPFKRGRMRINPYCHWCKAPLTNATATVDHLIPLSRGGGNGTDNLVLSCEKCNKDKGSKMPDEYRRGK